MTDILLIYPPYERLRALPVKAVPWSLLLLGTILRDAGHSVIVYNGEYSDKATSFKYTSNDRSLSMKFYQEAIKNPDHEAWQELREILVSQKPQIIGISYMTPTFSAANACAKICREILPDAKIIAGGPHCTLFPERMAIETPSDFIVIGEGDQTLLELVNSIKAANQPVENIKGIAYRKSDKTLVITAPRPFIDDLDQLPIPDRTLLWSFENYGSFAFGNLLASRGCPFDCDFCASVPLWQRHVRIRSVEHILKEVSYLETQFKTKNIRFFDDTFTANPKRVLDFCIELEKRGKANRISWNCEMRVNHVTEPLISSMKRAGCDCVSIGVESGSDRILKAINKRIDTQLVRDAVKIIRKYGLHLHAYFMVGLPMETASDIRATINFMREIKPDSINLCTFCPLPGTKLFQNLADNGVFKENLDFAFYDLIAQQSVENYFCLQIPRDEYRLLVSKAMKVAEFLTLRFTRMKLKRRIENVWLNPRFYFNHLVRKILQLFAW